MEAVDARLELPKPRSVDETKARTAKGDVLDRCARGSLEDDACETFAAAIRCGDEAQLSGVQIDHVRALGQGSRRAVEDLGPARRQRARVRAL